jgi:hypothetical protein
MIYILIFVWSQASAPHVSGPTSSGAVEFQGLAACQAAAAAMRKQANENNNSLPLLLCAAKGSAS